jgi:hypothetical protein
MSENVSSVLQNLDKRLGALEGEDIDDGAVLTQIKKMYGDFEIQVKLAYSKHQYPICGTDTICNTTLII